MHFIRRMYSRWYVLISGIARSSREALIIMRYAVRYGFPSGDEEYERIISEAMQKGC